MTTDVRTCAKCGQEKPIDEFHRSPAGLGGRKSTCRTCCAAYDRAYIADPAHRSEKNRKARERWARSGRTPEQQARREWRLANRTLKERDPEEYRRRQQLEWERQRREANLRAEQSIDPEAETRECSRCGECKPLTAFYRNAIGKDGRQPYCIECQKKANAVDYQRHKAKRDAKNRAWYQATRRQA